MYENLAWNNFEKTGNVESFLEYLEIERLKKQIDLKDNVAAEGVITNEFDQSKGSSYKGNNL